MKRTAPAKKSTRKKPKVRKEPAARTSPDLIGEQVERLREVFPEAFTEGKVDWDRLKETLGEIVDDGPERYSFTWAGKRDAVRLIQVPSRAALVPCPEESVNWDSTQHVFIEGENLEVLKLLYKAYFGRVKMIYIDPPYNTGKDRLYRDNYADPLASYLELTGQQDAEGNILVSNPETSGRYHSTWLSMMYPRLFLARQLLRDDGLIFVSIDDKEAADLRLLMNEIFGEQNALAVLVWDTGHSQQQGIFKEYHQYVFAYARNRIELEGFSGGTGEIAAGAMKKISRANPAADFRFPAGTRCEAPDGTELSGTWGGVETVTLVDGRFLVRDHQLVHDVVLRAGWTQLTQMRKYFAGEPVVDTRGQKVIEFYFSSSGKLKCRKDRQRLTPSTVLEGYGTQSRATEEVTQLFDGKALVDYPKPLALIRDFALWSTEPDDDVVVDFFAGSCTAGHAVLDLNRRDGGNRRFLMVQLPEPTAEGSAARREGYLTIAELGKERLRRAIRVLEKGNGGQQTLRERESPEDLGFRVFKLAASSFRQWASPDDTDPEDYAERLGVFEDSLIEGWDAGRVVWEVAAKEGLGPTSTMDLLEEIDGNTVWRVTDPDKEQTLHVCLDDTLSQETIRALGLGKDDLFVCRDRALDDTLAANLALQCRLKAI